MSEKYTPEQDDRLVRYMAMATPLGYQSALTVVQEMTKLLRAEAFSAERDRRVAERAWDEGYTRGNAHNGRRDDCPYRTKKGTP